VATVVLQLVAEHRLSLGDTIARWLPGLAPGGASMTVQELLQHTSGIYSYSSDPGFQQALAADPTRVWRPTELVRIAVAHPPLFPPGTAFVYSNTDYVLLGLIIQAVTGHPVGQQLQARIFRPLGLRDTYYPYADPNLRKPCAHGYLLGQPGATGPVDATVMSPSWAGAAGGIVSTAADLARFSTALLSGKLLPAAQLQEMMTTIPTGQGDDYGLGIQAEPFACGTAWATRAASTATSATPSPPPAAPARPSSWSTPTPAPLPSNSKTTSSTPSSPAPAAAADDGTVPTRAPGMTSPLHAV
jgi:D-alanyl-D-alanine carboxypeptidase